MPQQQEATLLSHVVRFANRWEIPVEEWSAEVVRTRRLPLSGTCSQNNPQKTSGDARRNNANLREFMRGAAPIVAGISLKQCYRFPGFRLPPRPRLRGPIFSKAGLEIRVRTRLGSKGPPLSALPPAAAGWRSPSPEATYRAYFRVHHGFGLSWLFLLYRMRRQGPLHHMWGVVSRGSTLGPGPMGKLWNGGVPSKAS